MKWTVATADVMCGSCGRAIPPNQPIALLTARQLVRCPACAGAPVDAVEVDHERFRLEQDRLRAGAPSAVIPREAYHPRPMAPLSAAAAHVFDTFDRKAAAAGRDD
jgi:hypothetical protein